MLQSGDVTLVQREEPAVASAQLPQVTGKQRHDSRGFNLMSKSLLHPAAVKSPQGNTPPHGAARVGPIVE